MRIRSGPAVYLSGMTVLGIVAALVVALAFRDGSAQVGPSVPPATVGASDRAQVESSPPATGMTALPSPHATAPPATATSTVPTSSGAPLTPGMTPLPSWLTIPEDLWDPQDPDRDGLTTDEEAQLGTDPYRWDTDAGEENDRSEVAAGRNPLDRSDDVPEASACIPPDAKGWDTGSPDESPPAVPELEDLLPDRIGGMEVSTGSMRGLPRAYGFFNFFWDGVLLCAGGQPEDMSHAIGVRGSLPGFTILAIRIDRADTAQLATDLLHDLVAAGAGRRLVLPQELDGRHVAVLLDADSEALTFAAYVSGDVLFLMTGMGATDSGLWPGQTLDPEYVREAVAALPAP